LHDSETLTRYGEIELSVVVPVFNERQSIEIILKRIQDVDVDKEIVIVDDRSTDGTRELLEELERAQRSPTVSVFKLPSTGTEIRIDNLHIIFQSSNQGKGAALQRGFRAARGNVVVIQDADLEYDPQDYLKLLAPIRAGAADVVIGSRFLGGPHSVLSFWHYMANRFLTTLSNVCTNLSLTDMETCYKMFRREILDSIEIRQKRFGCEPEIIAKVANLGYRFYEVPISYHGRGRDEGKKITWKDGLKAVWAIVKYSVWK